MLIGAVLVLFLAVAVMDFVSGFSSGWEEAKRGYNAGRSDARQSLLLPDSLRVNHFFVTLEAVDADATVRTFADGTQFTTLDATGELVVPVRADGGSGWFWSGVLKFLFGLVMTAAMVVFIVRMVMFAVGFPRRRLMDRRNIVSLRWIASSLGAIGLGEYGWTVSEYLWLKGHVALEGYIVSLPIPPTSLIVALIILAMTEILNLAGRLQNEQDLTI